MSYYVISGKQLVSSVSIMAIFLISCIWLVQAFYAAIDMPDVHSGQDGHCLKVINYHNGDHFTCQDVDVTLRKYNLVRE